MFIFLLIAEAAASNVGYSQYYLQQDVIDNVIYRSRYEIMLSGLGASDEGGGVYLSVKSAEDCKTIASYDKPVDAYGNIKEYGGYSYYQESQICHALNDKVVGVAPNMPVSENVYNYVEPIARPRGPSDKKYGTNVFNGVFLQAKSDLNAVQQTELIEFQAFANQKFAATPLFSNNGFVTVDIEDCVAIGKKAATSISNYTYGGVMFYPSTSICIPLNEYAIGRTPTENATTSVDGKIIGIPVELRLEQGNRVDPISFYGVNQGYSFNIDQLVGETLSENSTVADLYIKKVRELGGNTSITANGNFADIKLLDGRDMSDCIAIAKIGKEFGLSYGGAELNYQNGQKLCYPLKKFDPYRNFRNTTRQYTIDIFVDPENYDFSNNFGHFLYLNDKYMQFTQPVNAQYKKMLESYGVEQNAEILHCLKGVKDASTCLDIALEGPALGYSYGGMQYTVMDDLICCTPLSADVLSDEPDEGIQGDITFALHRGPRIPPTTLETPQSLSAPDLSYWGFVATGTLIVLSVFVFIK